MYTYTDLMKRKKDELLEIVGDLEIDGVDDYNTRTEIADAIIKFQSEVEKKEEIKMPEIKNAEVKMPEKKDEKKAPTAPVKPAVPAKPAAKPAATPKKRKFSWLY